MKVRRFKLEDLADITCASDFYDAIGYDAEALKNRDVFGNKAYYKNFIIHPETDKAIKEIIDKNIPKLAKKVGSKTRAKVSASYDWFNFAPICNGPRYDAIEAYCGRILRNTIYIVEPRDIMYERAPKDE